MLPSAAVSSGDWRNKFPKKGLSIFGALIMRMKVCWDRNGGLLLQKITDRHQSSRLIRKYVKQYGNIHGSPLVPC